MAADSDENRKRTLAKVSDYQKVFGSPQGRRVLADMMQAHGVFQSTFKKGDPYATHLHEGERNAVLRIMTILKVDMEKLETYFHEENY